MAHFFAKMRITCALKTLFVVAQGFTFGAYGLGVVECIVDYRERKQDIMAVYKHITPSEARTLLREARLETAASLVIFPVLSALSWPAVVINYGGKAVTRACDNAFFSKP